MRSAIYHKSSKLSVALSILCAIHCVLMPFIILTFPILKASFFNDPLMEWSILAGMVLLGTYSMDHYRKRHHGRRIPLYVFAIGVVICLAAMVFHGISHHAFMVAGSLFIASGQIINFTLPRIFKESE